MLLVEISLWPYGDPEGARPVTRAAIANVSANEEAVADYVAVFAGERELTRAVFVRGHRRIDGPWELLRRVTEADACEQPEQVAVPHEYARLVQLATDKLAALE